MIVFKISGSTIAIQELEHLYMSQELLVQSDSGALNFLLLGLTRAVGEPARFRQFYPKSNVSRNPLWKPTLEPTEACLLPKIIS